jgi:hypothetical protein
LGDWAINRATHFTVGEKERFAPPTSDTSRRAGKTHAMAELEDAFLECAPLAPRGGADDNIQVLVRVRPPNARELDQVRVAR